MSIFKKSVSYILVAAILLSSGVVFADTSFTYDAVEVDQSSEVYSFSDNFERDASVTDITKTGTGVVLDGNWSSKSSGSMDGDGTTGTTTFGFDGQDLAVSYFKQDTYPKVSDSQTKKMAGFNWTASHEELSSQFVIKTSARKTHNVNMWGIRFMQHNDEQNYYMLFLGGQWSYQLTSGVISWGLYKVKNGAVSILAEQLQTEDETRKFISTASDAELTLTYDNGKIDFNVAYNGDENYYSGTYTDDDPYILTGNDSTVQLVASSCGNSAYPIYFKNFSIMNYSPYITGGEPDNVIYNDIASYAKCSDDNVLDFFGAYPVRKIISQGLAGTEKDIYLSVDGVAWDKVSGAQFDSNGIWLNNKSKKSYRYLYYAGLNNTDLKVYTDISNGYVYDAAVTDVVDLVAIFGGVTDPTLYDWSVSNNTMAHVSDGVLTFLRRKGEVAVTATNGDVSHTAKFNIIGELEMATRNNTVEAYITEKKIVIDAVNAAIAADSFDEYKAIMRDEGTIKIGSIVDLDTTKVSALNDQKLFALFERLSTYDAFECSEPQDLYDFSEVLDKEYAVGEMCNIASTADFETAFNINNEYIGLETESFYFKNYKTDVFARLLNKNFASFDAFMADYNEAMIGVSYDKALSYVMVGNFLDFFPGIIGYNETHYSDVKGNDLYKAVLDNKGTLNTIEKLRQYIDTYTLPAVPSSPSTTPPSIIVTPPSGNTGGFSGGSGGGGGGGGGGSQASYAIVGKDEPIQPPAEVKPVAVVVFDDVDSKHWAYKSIVTLKNSNVINGYSDGCYYPDNDITRAEYVKILVGALKIDITDGECGFEDVSENDWFAPYVKAAKDAGLVEGDGNRFNGNSNITRQEMAVMIYRSLDNSAEKDMTAEDFGDIESVAEWAREAVRFLKEKNIITGYNNLFNPLDFATRAEVAQIISKVIQED